MGGFPASSRPSFSRLTSAAKTGAEAEVPPTPPKPTLPLHTTWKPSPSAATSGVARPAGGEEGTSAALFKARAFFV